jgi:hypothetical protein
MDTQVIAANLRYSLNNAIDYIREGSGDEAMLELDDALDIINNDLDPDGPENALEFLPQRVFRSIGLDIDSDEDDLGDDDLPDPYQPLDFHEDSNGRRW